MILLFGDKATKTSATRKSNSVKNNNPVENSGILAMGLSQAKSLLTIGEYDTYVFSNPTAINYSMYSSSEYSDTEESGFMSDFSAAVAFLGGDCGFSTASYDGGSSSSCSSFSSVG
jgi:hypothetical protein